MSAEKHANEKHGGVAKEEKGDRLSGETKETKAEAPKAASPEEPWDTPEFHDQVRAAGFPSSYFGDSAFMAAAWKLTGGGTSPPLK
jgi:hypothetical protein